MWRLTGRQRRWRRRYRASRKASILLPNWSGALLLQRRRAMTMCCTTLHKLTKLCCSALPSKVSCCCFYVFLLRNQLMASRGSYKCFFTHFPSDTSPTVAVIVVISYHELRHGGLRATDGVTRRDEFCWLLVEINVNLFNFFCDWTIDCNWWKVAAATAHNKMVWSNALAAASHTWIDQRVNSFSNLHKRRKQKKKQKSG